MAQPLHTRIQEDMKQGMKDLASDAGKLKLSVLRMLASDLKNKQIEKREELSEEDVILVIKKAVKQRIDAITQYVAAGREELAGKEREEMNILESYLPEEIEPGIIEKHVKAVIEDMQVAGQDLQKSFGIIMKEVISRAKGESDKSIDQGKVSQKIRDHIAKKA